MVEWPSKVSRSFCPTSVACESDESFEDTRRPETRRPRQQHSSLQWLIRLVTYTMVSLCSLFQACKLLAATTGSIPNWLLPTMGYRSWEWTCYHTMFQKTPNQWLHPPPFPPPPPLPPLCHAIMRPLPSLARPSHERREATVCRFVCA